MSRLDAREALVRAAYDNAAADSRLSGLRQNMGLAMLHLLPRRTVSRLAPLAYWPDRQAAWAKSVFDDTALLIERWKPDIIISTSPPFSSHRLAYDLSMRTAVPWAADFRDLWATRPATRTASWRGRRGVRLESRILPKAALITTASEEAATQIESVHRLGAYVIRNGFDPDDFAHVAPLPLGDSFNLVYTGALYYGIEDGTLPLLLDALAGDFDREIRLHYFGRDGEELARLAIGTRAHERLIDHGVVTRETSHAAQKSADLLVALAHNFGAVPVKFFDYVGSGSPILVIGGPTSELCLLASASGAANVASSAQDVHACIRRAIHIQLQSAGKTPQTPGNSMRETWTRSHQSKKWRQEIERVIHDKFS